MNRSPRLLAVAGFFLPSLALADPPAASASATTNGGVPAGVNVNANANVAAPSQTTAPVADADVTTAVVDDPADAPTLAGLTATGRERRDPAYFRGRARLPDPADGVLWVPRVLLSPLWVFSEFVVRRPIRAFAGALEHGHVIEYGLLAFHPVRNFTWSPIIQIDVGMLSAFGASATFDNVFVVHNQIRAAAYIGALDYYGFKAQDRITLGTVRLGVRGEYFTRPDRLFYGLGPDSSSNGLTRFSLGRGDAFVFGDWRPSRAVTVEFAGGYRGETVGPGRDPSIETVYQGATQAPGFGQTMHFLMGTGALVLDTRGSNIDNSGMRVDLRSTWAYDLGNSERKFYVNEAEIEGAIEVSRPGRVLSASIYLADSQALGSEPIPIEELPSLGRNRHLAFRWGRFVGESVALVEARYRYPIQTHLDWMWGASLGNAFGHHFAGFDVREFTGSFDVGFRTRFNSLQHIGALFAIGTRRIDDGFGFDSFRIVFNVDQGL